MRNFKKFLALVMATLMILSAAVITTGAADSKADYTEAAQHLVALKIMKGDEKGNLMLENGVTRYQAALFFAQTLSFRRCLRCCCIFSFRFSLCFCNCLGSLFFPCTK